MPHLSCLFHQGLAQALKGSTSRPHVCDTLMRCAFPKGWPRSILTLSLFWGGGVRCHFLTPIENCEFIVRVIFFECSPGSTSCTPNHRRVALARCHLSSEYRHMKVWWSGWGGGGSHRSAGAAQQVRRCEAEPNDGLINPATPPFRGEVVTWKLETGQRKQSQSTQLGFLELQSEWGKKREEPGAYLGVDLGSAMEVDVLLIGRLCPTIHFFFFFFCSPWWWRWTSSETFQGPLGEVITYVHLPRDRLFGLVRVREEAVAMDTSLLYAVWPFLRLAGDARVVGQLHEGFIYRRHVHSICWSDLTFPHLTAMRLNWKTDLYNVLQLNLVKSGPRSKATTKHSSKCKMPALQKIEKQKRNWLFT